MENKKYGEELKSWAGLGYVFLQVTEIEEFWSVS